MVFKHLNNGMFSSNCYILGHNGEGAVIDAGAEAGDIMQEAEKMGINIKYIILTHVHIDHICSVDELRSMTGAKVCVHEDDAYALPDPLHNGSRLFGASRSFKPADMLLKDGDIVKLGTLELEVIHTPGHTPGSICIKAENIIVTGDTLFRLSIGRTDLGNGDFNAIISSIKNKLMSLPDDTVIYPGHGAPSTIGYEKMLNPYI